MFLNLRSVMYEVHDLKKAKEWYSKVLEIEPAFVQPDDVIYFIGGDRMVLHRVDHPSLGDGSGTVAYWAVSNFKAELQMLLDNGATEFGTVRDMGNGILLATVKDPFGNIIGIGGSGGKPDNRAIEEKPSKTALWTTQMRAFTAMEENEEIRGDDYLAEVFLTPEMRDELNKTENRQTYKEKNFVIGICEYVMARTRIFDQFYQQAIERGVNQIVLLGAGYDSRPYRINTSSAEVRIIELDVPPTQERKKRCLAGAGIKIPANHSFAPINFNTQSLEDVLYAAGYDASKQTLFIWEGVTYYLGAEAVEDTLNFIKNQSPAGSMVAFDYIALWPGIFDAYGVKELIQFNTAQQAGESGAGFSIEEGAVESFFTERGFEISIHMGPEDLERNFLTLKNGTLFGRVTGSLRVAMALTTL